MISKHSSPTMLIDMRGIYGFFTEFQRHNEISLFNIILVIVVDLVLSSIEIHNECSIKDFELLYWANILDRKIEQIVLLRDVFVEFFFQFMLFLKIDIYLTIFPHWLELVSILTKFFRIFSKVYFDVRNITHLISCQNAKNSFLCYYLDVSSLKSNHINIIRACLVTWQSLTEQWNNRLDVTMYISGRLLIFTAIVDWFLENFWCAYFGRADVTQVGSLSVLTSTILSEKVFSILDHSVDIDWRF